MLRITPQNSAKDAKSYFATADYYTEGQEVIGHWGGKAAQMLGLDGTVSRNAFNRLCDNTHPVTGERLTARTKTDRTVGYDFSFSVPNSVSLLYALGEDKDILDAFRKAVDETMREIETEMKVRVRKKGKDTERATGNMVWAEFIHHTSRPVKGVPDVQLHAHCFTLNASFDPQEKTWKAGQFRELKREAPYFQAAFRARLANRLQDLGYAIDRKRGDFEIAGVPASAIKKFSRRTEKIEKLAREKGIDDPDAKAKLGALTREKKDKNLTWAELLREWNDRLTPEERKALDAVKASRDLPLAREDWAKSSLDFAIGHVFEREAVVSEKRLLAEALSHGIGNVSVGDLREEYARRKLPVSDKNGIRVVTTPAIIAEEEKLVGFARKGRGTCRPLGVPGQPMKWDGLNAGQRRAVRHILTSRDRVMLVKGAAGTGKTTLMKQAVEGIRQGGHGVVVLAPSAGASRGVLRNEGFHDADTVAAFLRSDDLQRQAAGNVIWVDEAGLLGNRDMTALFDIAAKMNSRVVLMGDRSQHASVARGTPLKLLEVQAGVPAVAVTDIVRQQGDYRKAVRLLSEGKTIEGFDELDRLGWVQEVPDQDRYLRLAEAYLDASSQRKADGSLKSALVVTPTHSEAERITEAIRHELAARRRLGGETKSKVKECEEKEFQVWVPKHLTEAERGQADSISKGDMLQFHQNARGFKNGDRVIANGEKLPLDLAARFQVFRPEAISIAIGDRLRITSNGKTRDGHRLNNGAIYTVKEFRDGNIVLDNDWVLAKDFGHFSHGYAVTSHASQGKTVDTVLIGVSRQSHAAADRAQMYVSASRGREKAILFTDDRRALREAVARDRERLTATEVFRRHRPGRERLKQHLSSLRRLIGPELPRQRTVYDRVPLQKEVAYERNS